MLFPHAPCLMQIKSSASNVKFLWDKERCAGRPLRGAHGNPRVEGGDLEVIARPSRDPGRLFFLIKRFPWAMLFLHAPCLMQIKSAKGDAKSDLGVLVSVPVLGCFSWI